VDADDVARVATEVGADRVLAGDRRADLLLRGQRQPGDVREADALDASVVRGSFAQIVELRGEGGLIARR
jgi:hypothetical protein